VPRHGVGRVPRCHGARCAGRPVTVAPVPCHDARCAGRPRCPVRLTPTKRTDHLERCVSCHTRHSHQLTWIGHTNTNRTKGACANTSHTSRTRSGKTAGKGQSSHCGQSRHSTHTVAYRLECTQLRTLVRFATSAPRRTCRTSWSKRTEGTDHAKPTQNPRRCRYRGNPDNRHNRGRPPKLPNRGQLRHRVRTRYMLGHLGHSVTTSTISPERGRNMTIQYNHTDNATSREERPNIIQTPAEAFISEHFDHEVTTRHTWLYSTWNCLECGQIITTNATGDIVVLEQQTVTK
jgi:hypothetical protein